VWADACLHPAAKFAPPRELDAAAVNEGATQFGCAAKLPSLGFALLREVSRVQGSLYQPRRHKTRHRLDNVTPIGARGAAGDLPSLPDSRPHGSMVSTRRSGSTRCRRFGGSAAKFAAEPWASVEQPGLPGVMVCCELDLGGPLRQTPDHRGTHLEPFSKRLLGHAIFRIEVTLSCSLVVMPGRAPPRARTPNP
jgi:hypothetical protein